MLHIELFTDEMDTLKITLPQISQYQLLHERTPLHSHLKVFVNV